MRAERARKKVGQDCAKKLSAAADALGAYALACLECNDESAPKRADDSRAILAETIREYAGWLEAKYGN
jgi:hypothetical protein